MVENRMPALWQAKWVDPELSHEEKERQPASVLRRRFTVNSTENAVLYITCHGLYEAELNGQRVGEFVLAPGTGEYRKRLTVQAYDVSALLRAGENELVVTLGDGWYRGNNGIDGLNCLFGSDLALLCQLELDGYKREADNLRQQLNMAQLAASQTAQTAQILAGYFVDFSLELLFKYCIFTHVLSPFMRFCL